MPRADARFALTRRSFLQAIGLTSACRLRFTSIADDLEFWFHRCFFGGGLRYAGAG